ncbi:MAG: hypothetical protein F4246_10200 [Rhodothermaceae bacterium]|nr:hypothetical protein [Rhodothermaceae bacterium]MYJ57326.1 hypothetical protein [Rhodothermaceae bacterium]
MPNLAPVYPEMVQIFLPGDSLPPHDRVAILAGSGADNWSNRTQLLDHLRRRAGELGANGVILGQVEESSSGEKIVGYLTGFGSSRKQDAIAILIHSTVEQEKIASSCESLKSNMDNAFQAYERQKNNTNRERWQRASRKYHEECG